MWASGTQKWQYLEILPKCFQNYWISIAIKVIYIN